MTERSLYSHDLLAQLLVDKLDQIYIPKHKLVFGTDGLYIDVTDLNPYPVTDTASQAIETAILAELIVFHADNSSENDAILAELDIFRTDNSSENASILSTLDGINAKIFNNYGAASGAIRTASQIGNITGQADFNAGTTGAQTLRTSSNITRNGTELSYNAGASDANTLRIASNLKREGTDLDYNFGTVDANTLRTASHIGNATGPVDFGYGTYGAQTVRTLQARALTYSAFSTFQPATSPTDVFTLTGSATKTIKITSILIAGTNTGNTNALYILLKRSTANSGGTSSTLTAVPHDSNSAAATATARSYTANPTLGTLVGNFYGGLIFLPALASTNVAHDVEHIFGVTNEQPIVLRGTSEVFSINFNGVNLGALSATNFEISVRWTEE